MFSDNLPGKLPDKHHITVRRDVCPTIHACRRVPIALLPKVKEKLLAMEKNGIIVKRDEPTAWVNSMLVVEKKDGSIRLCIDPRDLNKAIMREHYRVPTFDDVLPHLAGKKIFSIIDMKDGFWHIELDDESSKLVTFNTPFGRYSFTRLPFGISSAPEVFQKRAQQVFGDIPGVAVIFDDIIIAAETTEEHDVILRQLLSRARDMNVRFNRSKLQLTVSSVVYMGHVVSSHGIAPDPSKIRAIVDFPPPTSKEDLLRFNGMATYVSRYIPNFSDLTFPYRQLLKKDAPWTWAEPQQQAFTAIKQLISSAPVLSHYNPQKELVIQTDASSKGLGSCLMQDGHPISFASRALTDCETRYAQIEKELLAIVYACEKFNNYVYGRDVTVQSDHKPLESIFAKPMSTTTTRLQRMLIRLTRYRLNIRYTPGKEMHIADALSRAYLKEEPSPAEKELAEDLDVIVHSVLVQVTEGNSKLQQIIAETAADPILSQVAQFVTNGQPVDWKSLPSELKRYRQIMPDLFVANGLVLKDRRIVMPSSIRSSLLTKLHASHMGIEKTKQLARQYYYWPGMDEDIEIWIRRCSTCNSCQRKQTKQPLIQHPVPDYAWQKIGCDIFTSAGKDYLIAVDYFSKFAEISKLKRKNTAAVIEKLKVTFSRFGVPETVIADNVPFASHEFLKFARDWNFRIITSSPNHPQSNGQAERAIQTVKKLMRKARESGGDISKALLHLRATPISGTNVSPAELLFGRKIKTDLPEASRSPAKDMRRNQLLRKQASEKKYADRGSRILTQLNQGETVRIQSGNALVLGRVLNKLDIAPRSYRVITAGGQQLRRTRGHLYQTLEKTPPISVTAHQEELVSKICHPSHSAPIPRPPYHQHRTSNSSAPAHGHPVVFVPPAPAPPTPSIQSTQPVPSALPAPPPPPALPAPPAAANITTQQPALRRSTRTRNPPIRFSP